jgi:DNA primase small subunit
MGYSMAAGWARFAHRFGTYYRSSEFWTPPRLKTREWMFIPFGGAPPIRHKGFSDMNAVRQFITERSMHSCFYSTAYWERPFEMKMSDKNWLGADLIFDLDGDHLPGVTDRDFPGMIQVIQEQAWSLWNDFLEPEFGFDEKYLQVTFSGIEDSTCITVTPHCSISILRLVEKWFPISEVKEWMSRED